MYVYMYIYVYIDTYTTVTVCVLDDSETVAVPKKAPCESQQKNDEGEECMSPRTWGMTLSLHKHFFMTFLAFFLCLFRITFFDDLTIAFFFLCFVSLRNDTDFFHVSSFAPTTYTNILGGRQRPASERSPGVDLAEDAWRHS